MKIEIKNRWTGELIVEGDFSSLAELVVDAVKRRINLDGARLDGANLVGARLDGARLDGANLVGANLVGARLVGANLVGARLDGARLDGANLDGANLVGANLVGARLDGANLNHIRNDLWSILLFSRAEIPALRAALVEGRVNGSCYEGACCCLVGTIANARACSYRSLPGIKPDSYRPAERWFTGIKPGDTSESNQIVKITLGWIDEFTSALTEVVK